ncbi:TniQ family protein [Streptomyces sp. NBC_01363]|uniref:TniQ family protein n=1 Tax=Streptomyces sp. NBC_01363 TaxID=2903840 RepID=UPI002255230E|nr:TniQ family protein [Streptomyces sp. NBC_01363]MCX4734098.1 TniQ family protein [Streptomyces sp. NBC_01363]
MTSQAPRPLARSLAPLPGESLGGFLLRLSYRLCLTPHRVATLCGLACRSDGIPHEQMRGLGPEATERLARAAQLSIPEAHGLTLDGFAGRYPPLAKLRTSDNEAPGKNRIDWAANPDIRYCPRCLAGDDSPVQQAYGGAWQLRWHLPVVFACVKHRCLLQQDCPQCGQALSGRIGHRYSLLTLPHVPGLHPAQCRNQDPHVVRRYHTRATPCGARLDQLTSPATALAPQDLDHLLHLQQHLDSLLSPAPAPNGTGDEDQETAASYFGDLLVTARLILMSWPAGAGLLPTSSLTNLVGQCATEFASTQAKGNTGPKRRAPHSTAHSAALLLAAQRGLGDRDATSMRERLEPLTREVYRQSRSRGNKLFTHNDASPALLQATAALLYGAQTHARMRTGPHGYRYRLEEIPPLFPRQWYTDLLEPLTAQLPTATTVIVRHLRWAGSLRLVEIVTGQSWRTCAPALGIPSASASRTMYVLGGRMTKAGLWPAFEAAADEAARHLHDQQRRVNYAQRRRATEHWRLTREQWQALCQNIPGLEQQGLTGDTCVGEALLWSMVNEASYLHSPTVLHRRAASPEPDRITDRAGALLRRDRSSYVALRRRLEIYAAHLADTCDRAAPHSNAPASASHQTTD